jgi:uncharacterized protein YbjQ (UPF0145 family)
VSAHIVAGTNFFSDFFASFSDVFGGRSHSYQKQLTSLYNEAIERIKFAAYELGANCIVGLKIDMDEISGKGKSMFMLTAIGTAVILEKETIKKSVLAIPNQDFENVSLDRINALRTKKLIVEKAKSGNFSLDEELWNFITSNQVHEVFAAVLKEFPKAMAADAVKPGSSERFYKLMLGYIDALPEEIKLDLLYDGVRNEKNVQLALKLSQLISDLNLFDFRRCVDLLRNNSFQIKKRAVRVAKSDKQYYNRQDINDLQEICDLLKATFAERGKRIMKKQLLSSKEKELWQCECGKTNDIGTYCSGCGLDIYGFSANDVKPTDADRYIEQKLDFISEFMNS